MSTNEQTPTVTIHTLKAEKEARQTQIFTDNGVFFAFSNQQFQENKTSLAEGEKYAALFGGGYCPQFKRKTVLQELDALDSWYWAEIDRNGLRNAIIAYTLSNHECYYSGDISDAQMALPASYTEAEIWAIYRQNYAAWDNDN